MTKIYQIDAFADCLFQGNPAAVIPFDHWPHDTLLQLIAAENNLAETAFIVKNGDHWELRWFTPEAEVALCGHATLAAAYVIFKHIDSAIRQVDFHTRESGILSVSQSNDGQLMMSFPSISVSPVQLIDQTANALNCQPTAVLKGFYSQTQFDLVAIFASEEDVAALRPNPGLDCFIELGSRGVIATAVGEHCDFVSRYFAPAFGIPEDPVTGSAHCLLAPYWAEKLNKSTLSAVQISPRTGNLECRVSADRVTLVGRAVEYMQGKLFLPD